MAAGIVRRESSHRWFAEIAAVVVLSRSFHALFARVVIKLGEQASAARFDVGAYFDFCGCGGAFRCVVC